LNSFYFIKSYKKRIKNDIREQKKAHNLKLFFNINNDRDAQLRQDKPKESNRREEPNENEHHIDETLIVKKTKCFKLTRLHLLLFFSLLALKQQIHSSRHQMDGIVQMGKTDKLKRKEINVATINVYL
jgi:hypothetical protein